MPITFPRLLDAWIPAGVTWTYVSASTFTIPGDWTAFIGKSTRLKFTQTTVKYGVVYSASFGAGVTTITIVVNTDYVLANAVITNPYFSNSPTPIGYPTWFNFNSNPTGWAATPTQTISQFKIDGALCTVNLRVTGTSNATTVGATAPVASAVAMGAAMDVSIDNSGITTVPGFMFVSAGSAITAFRDGNSGAWTASATKMVHCSNLSYPI